MSGRRSSRSRHSNDVSDNTRATDDQISNLVSKLQHLIPELRRHGQSNKISASTLLQEACNYIRSLHREVDDLSDRLVQFLGSSDTDSEEATIIRSLLMQ
ncbi:hypothetical protein SAY87_016042 [Trapa incisa]|uniref:BHLH domain-containing protein n=1 Tax=Trapa incisa TaxID=236973 RepID=A0AAN7L651_9MYRT|nr:hypothetical protein SAY87_016042 [Trapa incisa]